MTAPEGKSWAWAPPTKPQDSGILFREGDNLGGNEISFNRLRAVVAGTTEHYVSLQELFAALGWVADTQLVHRVMRSSHLPLQAQSRIGILRGNALWVYCESCRDIRGFSLLRQPGPPFLDRDALGFVLTEDELDLVMNPPYGAPWPTRVLVAASAPDEYQDGDMAPWL